MAHVRVQTFDTAPGSRWRGEALERRRVHHGARRPSEVGRPIRPSGSRLPFPFVVPHALMRSRGLPSRGVPRCDDWVVSFLGSPATPLD